MGCQWPLVRGHLSCVSYVGECTKLLCYRRKIRNWGHSKTTCDSNFTLATGKVRSPSLLHQKNLSCTSCLPIFFWKWRDRRHLESMTSIRQLKKELVLLNFVSDKRSRVRFPVLSPRCSQYCLWYGHHKKIIIVFSQWCPAVNYKVFIFKAVLFVIIGLRRVWPTTGPRRTPVLRTVLLNM